MQQKAESSVGMTSGPLLPERTAKAASVSGTAGPMSRRPKDQEAQLIKDFDAQHIIFRDAAGRVEGLSKEKDSEVVSHR